MNDIRRRRLLAFLLVFALILIRFSYYGPTYFYQLDDYIQYHNYMAFHPDVGELIAGLGILAARPLAGLADLFVWSRFFPVMYAAVVLLSALYAASAVLFQAVFSRHVKCGWVFLLVYSVLPLNFEGTYWVSASSRVVCGLFFTALSAWLFQRALEAGRKGRRGYLTGFGLTQLMAFGFYEQALVLSFGLTLLLVLLNWKKYKTAALWGLWSFADLALFAVFTKVFSQSALYSGRMELMLPTDPAYWSQFFPRLLGQLSSAFCKGTFYTMAKGFYRGAGLLLADGVLWYPAAALALAALVFFAARRADECKGPLPLWLGLILGALLALGPLAPFFVLKDTWFSLRGTVFSLPGIALFADCLLALLLAKVPARKAVTAALAALFAFGAAVAGVSELHDYRATTLNDQAALAAIQTGVQPLADTVQGGARKALKVAVLGLEPSYLDNQNFFYHEHIHGVTESTWALTGAIQCYTDDPTFPTVTPVPAGQIVWQAYSAAGHTLEGYDAVYLYRRAGGDLIPVSLLPGEEPNTFRLLANDGSECAVAAPGGLTFAEPG